MNLIYLTSIHQWQINYECSVNMTQPTHRVICKSYYVYAQTLTYMLEEGGHTQCPGKRHSSDQMATVFFWGHPLANVCLLSIAGKRGKNNRDVECTWGAVQGLFCEHLFLCGRKQKDILSALGDSSRLSGCLFAPNATLCIYR